MNKEHLERVKAWNEFKNRFLRACQEIDHLRDQLEKGDIYHSSDFDNEKKSQIALAFVEKPINVYRNKAGGLNVETQWGCRLIYQLEYNGSVSVRVKDYDGDDFSIATYPSASKICKRKIKSHIGKFFLIEANSNKTYQPSFFCKLKYGLFKSIHKKRWIDIFKSVVAQIPLIKQIVKVVEVENKKP